MVRLVAVPSFHLQGWQIDFNSNMVRLVDTAGKTLFVDEVTFQFQYGAISRRNISSNRSMWASFQFQYGAISSLYPLHPWRILYIFQFQYGAISRCFFREVFEYIFNFNSNMVRLVDIGMVWLWYSGFSFQFQYGAISSERAKGIRENH